MKDYRPLVDDTRPPCQFPITKNSDEEECSNKASYHDHWGWTWCEEHAKDENGNIKDNMYELNLNNYE